MSQENVENVRQGIEAVNRQDVEAFVATASPDIEWEDSAFWSQSPRIYRGESELREWFNEVVVEPWESVHCALMEVIEATDERVAWEGLLTARGKDSGVETRLHFWTVQWFSDGEVTRRQVFLERAEALKAAGLSE
jgi:ketosteroid isomerase-like protein